MRELELKFSVHEPFAVPELVGAGSPVSAISRASRSVLHATYYDTDDLRLARSGITLRRRTGGNDAGWHLKLPLAGEPGDARDEITAPLRSRAVPAELAELVTAHTRGASLMPVATLRTARNSFVLFDANGEAAAELVDDTVSVVEGERVVERFREIEVESKGATLKFLKKVGAQLESAGAVAGTFMPKAIRALGSRASAPPDVEAPPAVSPASPAADVVTAFIRKQVLALRTQDPLVRQGAPDSVHQLRVAARQLRSGLKTFAPLVDDEWAASTREQLSWLATSLNSARDTEVMTERLICDLGALPESIRPRTQAALERSLTAARRRGNSQLRAALADARYITLLDGLVEATASPPLTPAAAGIAKEVLPPLAARAWRRLAKAIDAIDARSPDSQLHRARILAKQARYASEACALAMGRPAATLGKEIVRVQDVLGEHQDATVAAASLQRLAGSAAARDDAELAFALGVLYCRQVHAAGQARSELSQVWQRVSRRKHRTWLEQ